MPPAISFANFGRQPGRWNSANILSRFTLPQNQRVSPKLADNFPTNSLPHSATGAQDEDGF
jgi:hypothetical protein